MNELAQREVAVFNAARRLPASERPAFLDQACAGQAAMRQRLDELLQVSEGAADFLELPAQTDLGAAAMQSGILRGSVPFSEKPGDRIGRYKLLEKIGEGGCGVVYVAEQTEPVRRRVALKVIKLGMDTKQVVARFEAERQALAMMDHPNIAKVLDAGATDTGRPYFVMELVRGIRITDYCDQNRLTTKERLDLFIQVCQAIQHAHQKGVIHRDVKPANILVTLHDVVPVPKVIDFGIAKATEGRLTEATVYTQLHHFIGTPAYMSPEQAEISGLDIDTRSDIYSLGVLLYELLAGRTPFDAKELVASGLEEMRKTIRDKEPMRPSTRLEKLRGEELTTTAKRRSSDAHKLMRQLKGDLDWIVMKCLEKDRARRYETANGLAMDVQRHLKNEPVTARSPSPLYRFGRMVRRNKGVFAAMTAVLAALVLGLGASVWMYAREKRAFEEAETARANEAQLRRKVQERANVMAKISQADVLINGATPIAAEKLLNEIPPSLTEPDVLHAELRRDLAFMRAHDARGKQSVADFDVLLQVDPLCNLDLRSLDYLWRGTALVEFGETNRYEVFRQAAGAQFTGEKNPTVTSRMLKAILLKPADWAWMSTVDALYDETALFQDRPYPANFERPESCWACISLALADYRRGNYPPAVAWCRRGLAYARGGPDNSMAGVILAMSHQQLHFEDQARFELAYASAPIDEYFRTNAGAVNVTDSVISTFFDWIAARILLREATMLIGVEPSFNGLSPAEAKQKFQETVNLCLARRYQETEETLNAMPNIVLLLEARKAGSAFNRVGWWHLQNGRWPQARACWQTVVFGPDQAGSLYAGRELTDFCLQYAPLLVEMGDTNGYEKFREAALSVSGDAGDFEMAVETLTVCLLRPAAASLTEKLEKVAETVERHEPRQTNWTSWPSVSLALLDCRRGDYRKAMDWLPLGAISSNTPPVLAARCHLVAALACNGLGRRDQARSELARCSESIEKHFKAPIPVASDAGIESKGTWYDWCVEHVLLLEVKSLVEAAPNPDSKETGRK